MRPITRALLVGLCTLVSCTDNPHLPYWLESDEAEIREALHTICPAVTAARARPEAAETHGQLLTIAATGLPELPKLPAFEAFMQEIIDAEPQERFERIAAKVDEVGMAAECADFVAAYEAHAARAKVEAMPWSYDYTARGFRFVDDPGRVRPWKEGAYADVWAADGVAFTLPDRSSVVAPAFLTIVAVDAMTSDWVALDFATLRLVCEGDDRADVQVRIAPRS